jgi:hypothetical protein
MAGTVAHCELTRADGTRFVVAEHGDDAAIRRLLRENPMRGAIQISFQREPDYFRGANVAGGKDQTIVAFSGGRLACMGRCSRRACWVNGREANAGYLAELRLDAGARGRFGMVRDGFRFFHEMERENPAELYFTSIAADNERARRLLESGARGLPAYGFLAELDTLLIAVPRRRRTARLSVRTAAPEHLPAILRMLNEHRRSHQLSAVWTENSLRSLEQHGLPPERFLVAFDGGEMIACGALWDQRGFRQAVIHGYSRPLAMARPFLNLARHLLGSPHLPRAGSVLAHALLSPLAMAPAAMHLLPDFIEAASPFASPMGVEFLTLALPATDARLPVLRRRFATRTWRSRLYRVDWPDMARLELDAESLALLPEVSLL